MTNIGEWTQMLKLINQQQSKDSQNEMYLWIFPQINPIRLWFGSYYAVNSVFGELC